MLRIANPGHAPADANLRPARLGVQTRCRKFSITAAGWAAYESLRAHHKTPQTRCFFNAPGRASLFFEKGALPPNPGHAPADANLRPARLRVQTRCRKFSITAAGWAAYESLRAHGASTRQSLQCPASLRDVCVYACACLRVAKMQDIRLLRIFRFAQNYPPLIHFCSAGDCGRRCFFNAPRRASSFLRKGRLCRRFA